MESGFFALDLVGILIIVSVAVAGVLAYWVRARRIRLKLARTQKPRSLRLRPEVTARIDRFPGATSLILENVGGVDALDVNCQVKWELGGQEVNALRDYEEYKLPLPVLPTGGSQTFDLKFSESRGRRIFLKLSWKNRAGRVEKRSLGLKA